MASNLVNDQTYAYGIFTFDRVPNYSLARTLTATPKKNVTQTNTPSPFAEASSDAKALEDKSGDKSPRDTDSDGLTDAEEDALGTDATLPDTDGDTFSDKTELDSGHDPLNPPGKLNQKLVSRLRGRILLQVHAHGEAWYVNPLTGERHYLKDGAAALALLRQLGLGISTANLMRIPYGRL